MGINTQRSPSGHIGEFGISQIIAAEKEASGIPLGGEESTTQLADRVSISV